MGFKYAHRRFVKLTGSFGITHVDLSEVDAVHDFGDGMVQVTIGGRAEVGRPDVEVGSLLAGWRAAREAPGRGLDYACVDLAQALGDHVEGPSEDLARSWPTMLERVRRAVRR